MMLLLKLKKISSLPLAGLQCHVEHFLHYLPAAKFSTLLLF